jgi:hypothetical protein
MPRFSGHFFVWYLHCVNALACAGSSSRDPAGTEIGLWYFVSILVGIWIYTPKQIERKSILEPIDNETSAHI